MHKTPYSIANEVRLARTQYSGTYLLTEGDTDARVLGRFIDPQKCRTIDCRGKENAVGAIEILDAGNVEGVLAIVDADFDRIRNQLHSSPNILVTEHHDFDLTLLCSLALQKVLGEYGSNDKVMHFENNNGKQLLDHLLTEASVIGSLRLVSQYESLNLKFKGCRYSRFVDISTLRVDCTKLVQAIKNNSQNHELDDATLIEKCKSILSEGHPVHELCCGHDVTQLLSVGLRSALGSNNAADVEVGRVEASLRLAYESSFFQESTLKQSIMKWEKVNTGRVVLLSE